MSPSVGCGCEASSSPSLHKGRFQVFNDLTHGLLTVFRVPTRYFTASARQEVTIAAYGASATINILLNFLLIPRYGALGAALATLSSYTLESVAITLLFVRNSRQRISDLLIFRRADIEPYRRRFALMAERAGLGN